MQPLFLSKHFLPSLTSLTCSFSTPFSSKIVSHNLHDSLLKKSAIISYQKDYHYFFPKKKNTSSTFTRSSHTLTARPILFSNSRNCTSSPAPLRTARAGVSKRHQLLTGSTSRAQLSSPLPAISQPPRRPISSSFGHHRAQPSPAGFSTPVSHLHAFQAAKQHLLTPKPKLLPEFRRRRRPPPLELGSSWRRSPEPPLPEPPPSDHLGVTPCSPKASPTEPSDHRQPL